MNLVFWELAFAEAKKAIGLVSPNPAVGAVIVRGNTIVGIGHTQKPGYHHAEVAALQRAGSKARGATMYVTLEPCCHVRKLTGPCTNALIKAGIKKVIVATKDPNPEVAGKGIAVLKKAGIAVELLSAKLETARVAREINQPFFKAMYTGLPYVVLKAGVTLDGKIATKTGESKWITSKEARIDARLERSLCDAVLVGVGTVKADDPELAPHGKFKNKKLLRIIIDPELSLDKKYQVFRDENVLVVCTAKAPEARKKYFAKHAINVVDCGEEVVSWRSLLEYLGEQKIRSVYVEGGAGVHGSLVDAARQDFLLLDQCIWYIAPVIMGGIDSKTAIAGNGAAKIINVLRCSKTEVQKIGDDFKITGYLNQY